VSFSGIRCGLEPVPWISHETFVPEGFNIRQGFILRCVIVSFENPVNVLLKKTMEEIA
jgi:hypothetical protein